MTPKVDGVAMLVNGLSNCGVLVTFDTSTRASTLRPSRIATRLMRDASMERRPGPRNSERYGGWGTMLYWLGRDRNAVVSKYGFSGSPVLGSTLSPRRSCTGPVFFGLLMRMGRPWVSVIERGRPDLSDSLPLAVQPPTM